MVHGHVLQHVAAARGCAGAARTQGDRPAHRSAELIDAREIVACEGQQLAVRLVVDGVHGDDMARDLGIPDEKVRVVSLYMGGNFGNKNQNQDADLITAMLAKEAGAPVKLELSRKEDFIGVHGRWPTRQHYTVATTADGTLTAIRLRGVSGMGPYRKNSGSMAPSSPP